MVFALFGLFAFSVVYVSLHVTAWFPATSKSSPASSLWMSPVA